MNCLPPICLLGGTVSIVVFDNSIRSLGGLTIFTCLTPYLVHLSVTSLLSMDIGHLAISTHHQLIPQHNIISLLAFSCSIDWISYSKSFGWIICWSMLLVYSILVSIDLKSRFWGKFIYLQLFWVSGVRSKLLLRYPELN